MKLKEALAAYVVLMAKANDGEPLSTAEFNVLAQAQSELEKEIEELVRDEEECLKGYMAR